MDHHTKKVFIAYAFFKSNEYLSNVVRDLDFGLLLDPYFSVLVGKTLANCLDARA